MENKTQQVIFGLLIVGILGLASVFVTAMVAHKTPASTLNAEDEQPATEAERAQELAKAQALSPQASISAGQAQAIATTAVDTQRVGSITEVGLEDIDGVVAYAIEFTNGGFETDVFVDATTGLVLAVEDDATESDADE